VTSSLANLTRVARTPYGLIAAAYVVLRLNAFAGVKPLIYRDTESYLELSRQSLLSLDFWAGERSWTVPLLYKLLPDSAGWRTFGQFALSVVCWLALAVVTAHCLAPGRRRVVAFTVVLLFSAALPLVAWDTVLLTESVSISLTAAVVAAWLALARAPSAATASLVLGATLLWVFARDSNVVLAAGAVALVAVWALRAERRALPLALMAGLAAICVVALASTGTDAAQLRRTERPILHVVGFRVLGNADQTRWFRDHGMPAPTANAIANRRRLAAIGHTVPTDPPTEVFLEWVRAHGRGALVGYLLTHPYRTVKPVVGQRRRFVNAFEGYRSRETRAVLPATIDDLVYPATYQAVFFWLVAVGLGAAAVARRHGARATWLVPLAIVPLQIPHALAVWHGDTLEIPRHGILVGVLLRLAVLLAILLAADALLSRRREQGVTEPGDE